MQSIYTLKPKKYVGVEHIPRSALEDIVGVLKAILGNLMLDYTIQENCVVVTAVTKSMDDVIRRSNMRNSCTIEKKGATFN